MDAAVDSAQARKKRSSTAPGSVGAAHLQSFFTPTPTEHIAGGVGAYLKKRRLAKSTGGMPYYRSPARG
jgi:hypothetical protein